MAIKRGIVTISMKTGKMGPIPSVSLPAGLTCRRDLPCFKACYARRLAAYRSNVRDSYMNNLDILDRDIHLYFLQVEAVLAASRFFRFHVSGDIPDMDYMAHMVDLAIRYPKTEILVFTKQYEIVNEYLDTHDKPDNLHINFSAWKGLRFDNRHNLPVCHLRFKDGTCEAKEGAFECHGHCIDCAMSGTGCWALKNGDEVVMDER